MSATQEPQAVSCTCPAALYGYGHADAVGAQALRALARRLAEAGRMMTAATDELMTELVSKKRAANWGVINGALVAMGKALATPEVRALLEGAK